MTFAQGLLVILVSSILVGFIVPFPWGLVILIPFSLWMGNKVTRNHE